MDLNNLERGQLHNLQNHEVDFDQDAMWKNIQQPKKKRKPVFWFWLGGFASILLALLGLFISDSNKIDSVIEYSNYLQSSSITAPKTILSQSEKENSLSLASTTNKVEPTNITTNKTKTTETKIFSKTPKNIDLTKQPNLNISTTEKKDLPNPNQIILLDSEKNISIKKTKKESTKKDVSIENAQTSAEKEEEKTTNSTLLNQLPSLPLDFLEDPNTKLGNPPPIIPIKKPRFTISAFAGIGYQFKKLELKNPEFNQAELDLRNNTESILETIALGLEIDKNIGKNGVLELESK